MRKETLDSAKDRLIAVARRLNIDEDIISLWYGFDDLPHADVEIVKKKQIGKIIIRQKISRFEKEFENREGIFKFAFNLFKNYRLLYMRNHQRERSKARRIQQKKTEKRREG